IKDPPASAPAAKLYAALCDTVLADHARGRETLAAASRLAPQDPDVWQALAAHDLDRGQPALAARSYTTALALRPQDPVILAGLAYCHSELGQSARVDAHMILQRLARRRNDSAGVAAEAQAIASLNEDLARRQSLGRALRANLNRAEPLLAARQFAQAIPYYEEIVRILPDFYEA